MSASHRALKVFLNTFVAFSMLLYVLPFGSTSTVSANSQDDALPSDSWGVALGDLDGDGDLDAFVANQDGYYGDHRSGPQGFNEIWFNDGNANFSYSGQQLGQEATEAVDLADLDGDGDLDAFTANTGGAIIWVNDGAGYFSMGPSLGNANAWAVDLGDLDNDGDMDAFVGVMGGQEQVWTNQGGMSFVLSQEVGSNDQTRHVALSDLDGDLDLDVFIVNHFNDTNVVYLNDGTGYFTHAQTISNQDAVDLSLGDVDGDGDVDAFVGNSQGEADDLYRNDGTGHFSLYAQIGNYSTEATTLGDLDGDGDLDIYIGDGFGNPNRIWFNDGDGGFTNSGQSLGFSYTFGTALGDLDNDGDLDIFDANMAAEIVWLNDGNGAFTFSGEYLGQQPSFPGIIQAGLKYNWIEGRNFTPNSIVNVSIYGSEGGTLLYGPESWGADSQGRIWLNDFDHNLDIRSGMFITMLDGASNTLESLVVEGLMITQVDYNAGFVSGTAPANTYVAVWLHDDGGFANTTSSPDGNWSVNFGSSFSNILWPGARVYDEDGDETFAEANRPNFAISKDLQWVIARDWPLESTITLTIEAPGNGIIYQNSQMANPSDWNPDYSETFWNELGELQPGWVATVSGGGFTKVHEITDLTVTSVNSDLEQVSGTTSYGSYLWISVYEPNGANRILDVSGNFNWLADFRLPGSTPETQSTFDLIPGTSGGAQDRDEDGDWTEEHWRVSNPNIQARANDDRIEGYEWPLGATVNLEIDDPDTQANPDYSDSAPVVVADWDPNQTWFNIEFAGLYDLKIGDAVTVTDGSTTKQHTVVNLNFTQIATDTDQVFGTADANQLVNIWTCWESDPCINRDETADQNGNWETNFSIPGEQDWEQDTANIRVGSWIDSSVNDEDGDATMFGLTVEPPQCSTGTSISGTVFEHDGVTPVPNATVQFESFTTGEALFTTATDQNGQFGCFLPDGDYRVVATRDNYSREYFDHATDADAARLAITSGTPLTSINFTLSRLATMEHLTFNLDNPLLQELSVRQAIFLGIDRQEILNQAFLPNGNFGVVSNSIVPPEHWAAAPASELTLYPYDPTQAETILDAAGWINRDADVYRENASGVELALTFKTTQAPLRVAASKLFRQYMEQIGIRITVENIPAGEFFGDTGTVVSGDFDIAEFAWGGGYDDETFLESYVTGSVSNHSGYSNPAFDTAMANAAAVGTEAEKLTYYYEAQAILSEDLPIIPYFTRYDVAPVATDPGTDVMVSPEAYLDIQFDEVTDGGVTTVLPLDIDPADLPPNFQVLGQVYDIGTSAAFTSAQVCFSYDDAGLTLAQEESIQLLHLENGSWVNVTDNGFPDTINNLVCGTVTSFSPFAIVYSDDSTPPAITWVGDIHDGDTFYFNFVPAAPICTATDGQSGMDGGCTVTGYSSDLGSHMLTATARDNAGNVATESRTYTVLPWMLNGFYQPVDMNGVYNLVKGGSTVPFKFEIFAGSTELTNTSAIKSIAQTEISCSTNAPTDLVEFTVTGDTSLRYDAATGQFIYNWKTPKSPGKCYRVTMTTMDGSTLLAYFKLK